MHLNARLAASVVVAFVSAAAPAVSAQGITSEQADAILQELRNIRTLLERQQQQAQRPAQPQAPAPELVKLKLGREQSLGRADAPVVVVEYSDLQCPFCSRFRTDAFAQIKKQYIDTGKVRYVARDFPLEDIHPQALRAAQAAQCAADQGKFWEASTRLFANNASLTPQSIDQIVKDTGVNAPAYQACIDSGKHIEAIRASAQSGREVGISGTPSFVVGRMKGDTLDGVKLVGAMPFNVFDAAIKDALAK